MIECAPDHPDLPGLFDPQVPNNAALWAVFLGRHAGRAWVDDLYTPQECVLRTETTLTYASRQVTPEFLAGAIVHFKQVGPIWLVHPPHKLPGSEAYKVLPRLEFYDLDNQSPILATLRNQIPDGYEIRLIDQALLERCEWRDDMKFYSGRLENFLRYDLGLCLMHGEEIIAEAYACPLGFPTAEIGAITHESFRGKGFAPITVAFLIEKLDQLGYQAYWSCDTDNPASAQVARKLGFRVEQPYEIWEYRFDFN